jgi:hypothetical protein
LSPRLGPRKKSAGEAFKVGNVASELGGSRRRRGRDHDMRDILYRTAVGLDVLCSNVHAAERVADPPLPPAPAFHEPALRQTRDPRLEELIRRNPEEVGDLIQVCQLQLARALQKLVDRGGMDANRHGERFLVFLADPEQGFDILAQLLEGLQRH